jgi:hypothetical protein
MAKPQVVITRKDKRFHKGWHLLAFLLTGGMSASVTATKAATNAAYNARTRKLQEPETPRRRGKRAKMKFTDEERAYMAAHVPGKGRND